MNDDSTYDVDAEIGRLESTSESYHFRVTLGLKDDISGLIGYMQKKFKRYVVAHEIAEHPHIHVYCELPSTVDNVQGIRQTFIQKFPQYKGTGQYYLKKCKTNDWQNMKYVVKSKDIRSYNIPDLLLERAMEQSFEKTKSKPIKHNKWSEAKDEFYRRVQCGILTKHYTNEHILEFCIDWYGTQGPFNESHIEKLFNYISINMERTRESRRLALKAKLMSALDL